MVNDPSERSEISALKQAVCLSNCRLGGPEDMDYDHQSQLIRNKRNETNDVLAAGTGK